MTCTEDDALDEFIDERWPRAISAVRACQEAALTRHIAWQRSGGGVGLGPSGKQLYPATPEFTAWQEGPADSSQ